MQGSQANLNSERKLRVGAVVWVDFPFSRQQVKTRPCLVVGAMKTHDGWKIDLVSGTTTYNSHMRPTEFEVSDPKIMKTMGLLQPTRFNAFGEARQALPYTQKYFRKAHNHESSSVSGYAPREIIEQASECVSIAKEIQSRHFKKQMTR